MSGTNTGARVKSEAYRYLAFGSINSTLTQMGALIGFTLKELRFSNTTDVDLDFSIYNGLRNIRVASGSAFTFDLQTNNMCMVEGDAILVAYTSDMGAPTKGNTWVETYYT
jgi:hypothetical protein